MVIQRRLTAEQQALAEKAMAIIPHEIRRFLAGNPCLRKTMRQVDMHSVASMAVVKASFTYDPSKSKMSAYYGRAVWNALYWEAKSVPPSKERAIPRAGESLPAREAGQQKSDQHELATVMRALESMPAAQRQMISDRVLTKESLLSMSIDAGMDWRTIAKRIRKALDELGARAADSP